MHRVLPFFRAFHPQIYPSVSTALPTLSNNTLHPLYKSVYFSVTLRNQLYHRFLSIHLFPHILLTRCSRPPHTFPRICLVLLCFDLPYLASRLLRTYFHSFWTPHQIVWLCNQQLQSSFVGNMINWIWGRQWVAVPPDSLVSYFLFLCLEIFGNDEGRGKRKRKVDKEFLPRVSRTSWLLQKANIGD